MSTEVVDWKAQMAARVSQVQEDEQPAIVQMSLASGMMSIMDTPIPGNQLDCVILAMGTERTFYDRPYDPDDKSPPDCYSQKLGNDDAFNATMSPAANVPNPIAATCAECPKSKLGSAERGKGAACKTRRRLLLAPASVVGHPEKLGKQLVILNVPPTSGRNFGTYVTKLAGSGVPPEAAVTKIKYGPSKKFMFEMNFEPVEPIRDDATLSAIFSSHAGYGKLILNGYNYDEEEEPAPAPAKGGKAAKY